MAAGVIRNSTDFKLPTAFQHSFLNPSVHQDMDFQDLSDEEDEEEEMEDELDETQIGPKNQNSEKGNWNSIANSTPQNVEMASQLLRFAELINKDIQRYFGRKSKEEDPDSCNIYEDRFSSGKSGRELYYADLLRIARSGDNEEEESICDKDGIQKLGPLSELFEYGLHRYLKQRSFESRDGRKQKLERKYAHVIPMYKRRLPPSFWKEPSPSSPYILNSNTPDFSDLLANWTSDTNHELHSISTDASINSERPALES
uniref:Proline and glutamate rich with coiled coil 1 n=1 Tax=Latimeria chalumnae TaxID=7897 RepID=H3AXQ2_LATCH